MSKIEWNESNLPNLGRVFLRKVLDNMRPEISNSTVRFGQTGQGIRPNYQVTFENGVTRALNGSSHEAFDGADEFNSENVSGGFSFATIKGAYDRSVLRRS